MTQAAIAHTSCPDSPFHPTHTYSPPPSIPPLPPPPPPNRYKAKKRAFTRYVKKYADGKKAIEAELEALKKHCCVIRVLAHTQVRRGAGRSGSVV